MMPMRFSLLKPSLLFYGTRPGEPTMATAQGVLFTCPECYQRNGNTSIGAHSIICWSRARGVPDSAEPGPGRWALEGALDNFTLGCDGSTQRSVQPMGIGGCAAHFYVINGEVTQA